MATRWGILSAGKIAHDFTAALKYLPPNEHEVVGVAARSKESAQKFADTFSIPNVYGSYEELCKNTNIDIIYVATIHPFHYDVCKLALGHKKHVLCEKPVCMNSRQTEEVLQLASSSGLFFMEGFWSRCFPVYRRIREALAAGEIGEPMLVQSTLGITNKLDKGALLGMGCYTVQFADLVLGKPATIAASGCLKKTGVDESAVITLNYAGNKMAVLTTSSSCVTDNRAIISGTKGKIEVPAMWCPTEIIINGKTETFPLPTFDIKLNYTNSQGFIYEAQHIREMLQQGRQQSSLVTHESSLNIMRVLDEARRQIRVVYEADKI